MNHRRRIARLLLTVLLVLFVLPAMAENVELNRTVDSLDFIPSEISPYAPRENETGYWVHPMDITDEAAVWEMLMQPVTVVMTGAENESKRQLLLRTEPDEKSAPAGEVTCVTQGVRVLEHRDDGWTRVECYSSSFHNSTVKAWNKLVQGWIRTEYLTEVNPDPELAFVVDKLTQRLYIFQNGKLLTTLLVSTGLANKRQPYNETRAGEFLLQNPAVGAFTDGNMTCNYAIRFNSGDLLHEVPHTTDTTNYSAYEGKLGSKASHGCIRTQRKLTPEGVNIYWIWKHRKNNMKIVIWEDWQGRQIPMPDEDTVVYVNGREKVYHRLDHCETTGKRTLTATTYGEVMQRSNIKRCTSCNPPMTRTEIEERNAQYRFEP